MKKSSKYFSSLFISILILFTLNIYSQQIEYNIYAVYGINGNKINDSTVVGGDVGYIAGYWENGEVIQYPTLPNFIYARVYDINNSKVMVGHNYNAYPWASTATLWDNDTTINLGVLPGFVNSRATSINSNGVIVGSSYMSNGDSSMSFQIINNNMQIINVPNGYWGSEAWDINDNNNIAGFAVYSETPTSEKLQHAAIWINGTMSDINGQSYRMSRALSINNNNKVCFLTFSS